jgi:hypothetical protein
MNIAIRFADITSEPLAARSGSTPAKGLPEIWLDALIGAGYIVAPAYADLGHLSRISLFFPTQAHAEQFTVAVRHVANLLGTRAEVEGDGALYPALKRF